MTCSRATAAREQPPHASTALAHGGRTFVFVRQQFPVEHADGQAAACVVGLAALDSDVRAALASCTGVEPVGTQQALGAIRAATVASSQGWRRSLARRSSATSTRGQFGGSWWSRAGTPRKDVHRRGGGRVRHDREREKGGNVQDSASDRDRPHAQASVHTHTWCWQS